MNGMLGVCCLRPVPIILGISSVANVKANVG
jgi:hypothetical protein